VGKDKNKRRKQMQSIRKAGLYMHFNKQQKEQLLSLEIEYVECPSFLIDEYIMEDTSPSSDARFSILAMTLNALERSRANERLLGSYKCPCTECKGGGRVVSRKTIESHLRRHG